MVGQGVGYGALALPQWANALRPAADHCVTSWTRSIRIAESKMLSPTSCAAKLSIAQVVDRGRLRHVARRCDYDGQGESAMPHATRDSKGCAAPARAG
jgi:hypothetical protein